MERYSADATVEISKKKNYRLFRITLPGTFSDVTEHSVPGCFLFLLMCKYIELVLKQVELHRGKTVLRKT